MTKDRLNDLDVCELLVRHSRANMIGNEPQALALFLAAATSLSNDPKFYAPCGIVGELSSGKTHLVKIILGESVVDGAEDVKHKIGLFPAEMVFHFTSGSKKATIYSESLREVNGIRIINASEYQKLEGAQIEYFKAQSGDDPMFAYEFVTMQSQNTVRIEQPKRWFVFTYAQVEMDGELKSRMIVFSVEENKKINQEVNAMNHGKPYADYKNRKYTLDGDPEAEQALRDIITEVGEMHLDTEIYNPFWEALSDFEDCEKPSSKRVSRMNEALFRASAKVNFRNRDVNADGEIVMSAQDIVNVLAFADVVQSMILEVDAIDLSIIRYIKLMERSVTNQEIINAVSDSGLAELKGRQLMSRLEKLEDDNYLIRTTRGTEDDKKLAWYVNPRKRIHPITVYWDKIYEHDDDLVVDPITGDMFEDILEYGDHFDRTFRKSLEGQDIDDEFVEDTKESRTKTEIERLIVSGEPFKTVQDIANAVRRKLGASSLSSFDNGIDMILADMINDGSIEFSKQRGCFVMIDPTMRESKRKPVEKTNAKPKRRRRKA